jgi:hypothetical protein
MVWLKFSQLGCDTHPFSYPSGTGSVEKRTEPWGIEVNAWFCNSTHYTSRWRAATEAHGQLYTSHQRQPKSYEYIPPPLYRKNSCVYLPRVFSSKQIHARNIDAYKLHVFRNTERVNLVMTSVTSISITVLKLFLPDVPRCGSVRCWTMYRDVAV